MHNHIAQPAPVTQMAMGSGGKIIQLVSFLHNRGQACRLLQHRSLPLALQQLIDNFRGRSWFASDGLFVCGETLNAPVNEQLRALNTDGDARTGFVSATGLESLGDEVHFNAASLRVLGSRYADKYRSMSR